MSDNTNAEPHSIPQGNSGRKANGAGTPPPGPEVISDPGIVPQSKYATLPAFAVGGAIARHTPVINGHPKTYCRSFPHLAVGVSLIDAAKANEVGKKLCLISPEAQQEGALEGLPEAYSAIAVPFMDRDGVPHLWSIRQFNRDGAQLESYDKAMHVVAEAGRQWVKFYWLNGGYQIDEPRAPEKMVLRIPETLKVIDDWIEAAFVGRIIRHIDADELARIRGEQ